jgi:hypothetical protein
VYTGAGLFDCCGRKSRVFIPASMGELKSNVQ